MTENYLMSHDRYDHGQYINDTSSELLLVSIFGIWFTIPTLKHQTTGVVWDLMKLESESSAFYFLLEIGTMDLGLPNQPKKAGQISFSLELRLREGIWVFLSEIWMLVVVYIKLTTSWIYFTLRIFIIRKE